MRRVAMAPRPDWRARCEAVGFDFHTIAGEPYWDESAAYRFDLAQVETLEAAAEDLHACCLELVDALVSGGRFEPFALGDAAVDAICASWRRRDPSLYGRFDLSWEGGTQPPKLLEFNADTPTGLLEASVVQWYWLKDVHPGADQFNRIHEDLVARWARIAPPGARVHFAALDGHAEDGGTARYLGDTAREAGLVGIELAVEEIGWHRATGAFVDVAEAPIDLLFKLYPWEWMWDDAFAAHLPSTATRFLEPPWKLLLSSKAILPLLWERFPDHPNLLPASFEDVLGRPVVRKPLYSREGANVELLDEAGVVVSTAGPYDSTRCIHQRTAMLPCFDGRYPVIGAWVVGERAAGIGIREDASPITRDTSRFIPHYFEDRA
jgi:glutathionylspermidine synthase